MGDVADQALSLRALTKRFGSVVAVDSFSLDVPRGSILGLIGPNGSGKTTTIRMIMGIVLPDGGEIDVLGHSSATEARDRVGYLPEERGLYRKMSVERVLRYLAELKGMRGKPLQRAIDHWLERFDLRDAANRKVEALSKGMAQKVQFIGTVVSSPELLVLDEPFSGLDPVNVEVLKEAVLELREGGATVILSTHDMSMAERLCDRIAMVFRGRKVLDGTLDEIQRAHGRDAVRLELPQGRAALEGIDGVTIIAERGGTIDVELAIEPGELLAKLVATTEVLRFERARPSLHDIFVALARPDPASVSEVPRA